MNRHRLPVDTVVYIPPGITAEFERSSDPATPLQLTLRRSRSRWRFLRAGGYALAVVAGVAITGGTGFVLGTVGAGMAAPFFADASLATPEPGMDDLRRRMENGAATARPAPRPQTTPTNNGAPFDYNAR